MDRNTGRALDGTAHLAQSIGDILSTPIGSRPMRRDYGSLIFDLLDQPFNGVTRALIFAATALALRAWEPRIRLLKAALSLPEGAAAGQVLLTLDGERTDLPSPNRRVTLSIPLRTGGVSPARP